MSGSPAHHTRNTLDDSVGSQPLAKVGTTKGPYGAGRDLDTKLQARLAASDEIAEGIAKAPLRQAALTIPTAMATSTHSATPRIGPSQLITRVARMARSLSPSAATVSRHVGAGGR